MFTTKSNHKRSAPSTPSPVSLPSLNIHNGLFECYNFLSPNEYSEHTFGLLAFLVRSSVGEINFSHIIDEAEKQSQQGKPVNFVTLLEEKRTSLPAIEASIEKCLMLNRFVSYIKENETKFIRLISDIRLDMKLKMADHSTNQTITYPNDFRQREYDFNNRRNAQDMRRLFYLSHKEAKEPPSLIHLQNRTTEHLSYIIDSKMRYDSKFRSEGLKELDRIFHGSFMIISQPHWGVNPVTTYERKESGEYVAKLSVTVVSLLHDFMVTHPKLIELFDIETSLWPLSPLYKLDESQTLSWKTCELQISPGDKPRRFQYAELSFITILPSNKPNARIRFSEALYSLKFAIKLHLNLNEYKISKVYQIPLETSSFGIVSHNNQIPHILAKVIISDIERFSQMSSININIVLSFILRYFKHRTGVAPYEHLRIYVEKELNVAKDRRKNFQTLENIFMDFLIPFVHQVEFMAKHPIIPMFYADGLCLGICNSERAAEVMINSSDENSPIVGLRMNSIKIDYDSIATSPASCRTIKQYNCAVRVDIYNKRTKKLQYRTFDSNILANDISKFVSTAHSEKASYIRILSSFDNRTDSKPYRSFTDFDRYYDDQLHEIYKTNEKYKPITDIILNVEDGDDDDYSHHSNKSQSTDLAELLADNPHSVPPVFTSTSNHEHASNSTNVQDCTLVSYAQSGANEKPLENVLSPSYQQSSQSLNHQDVIQYALSQPDILAELLRRINIQHQVDQLKSQMQSEYPQRQPLQQRVTPPVISNHVNNGNQCQQLQTSPNHDTQWFAQQNSTQVEILPMSEDVLAHSTKNPFAFTTKNQTSSMVTNEDLIQLSDEFFLS